MMAYYWNLKREEQFGIHLLKAIAAEEEDGMQWGENKRKDCHYKTK